MYFGDSINKFHDQVLNWTTFVKFISYHKFNGIDIEEHKIYIKFHGIKYSYEN